MDITAPAHAIIVQRHSVLSPAAELKYCISLAKRHTNELGFIPADGFRQAQDAKRLRLQLLNGEPCGYLLHTPIRWGYTVRVAQTVIQVDARRLASATELVAGLIHDARAKNCPRISLKCAADLEANAFWLACGFELITALDPGNVRGRLVNLYRLELTPASQLLLF